MVDASKYQQRMNVQPLASALILASLHILLALAFTLTYHTTKTPNFSIGQIMAIGAYQSFTLTRVMNMPVYLNLPIAVVFGFIVNSDIYLLVIKPLTHRKRNPVMMTWATLGLSITLEGLIRVYAYWIRDLTDVYSFSFLLKQYDFQQGKAPGIFFVSSIAAFLVYILWRHVYSRTSTGLRYRAILENPQLAAVQGINIEKNWLIIWGISGSLACLAGAMCPIWFSVSSIVGTQIVTGIITASILGGLGNHRGFFIGGLSLGFLEIMITDWASRMYGTWIGEYRPFIPIAIMALTLMYRPQGL
ncbi:MAG: branched-chain amino acid ABC transporter permease, partial [Candidatus Bathyarchaeota archaeon]|nr:branched-chain amino acid ABC transporter permease [Candidatus Bathyarchaeota archaeon]